MQCANVVKKRSLETVVEPWSCTPKRMCLEAELPAECPMEMSQSLAVASQQQQVVSVRPRSSPLSCPRCLGGEPGHINHIMGL